MGRRVVLLQLKHDEAIIQRNIAEYLPCDAHPANNFRELLPTFFLILSCDRPDGKQNVRGGI